MLSVLLSFNCTKLPDQPDLNAIKLNLPLEPFEYNILRTSAGNKYLRYEDSSIIDNNKATIGRILFYDKALSINNSISCSSCHSQENAFADAVPFSKGFEGVSTLRNSMHITNLFDSRKAGYFWDGRESRIEEMVFAPIANHIEMGFGQIEFIPEKIGNLPYYRSLFMTCYGDAQVTEKRMRECLGQFLYSIVSENSKFDKSLQNPLVKLSEEERWGLSVFERNCMSCHAITDDNEFSLWRDTITYANIGLDVNDADKGRNGLYKIPSLRNVSKTAPYMHDGRFKTLPEVLNHYRSGIKANPNLSEHFGGKQGPWQLYMSDHEVDFLLAFLKTLDDDEVTKDPKFSSPF